MFARGLVSLNTPPLLGRKSFEAKFCVSVSSKLIEIEGLQLYYFGHLRKTGGRGSYRLVHTAHLPVPESLAPKSNYSHTYEPLSRKSNYSRTYAIPRGWGLVLPDTERDGQAHLPQRQRATDHGTQTTILASLATSSIPFISPASEPQPRMSLVSPTYAKTGGVCPCKNVGAPTFLIFPLISRTFLALRGMRRVARRLPASEGGRYSRTERRQECLRHWSLGTGLWPFTSQMYPIAEDQGQSGAAHDEPQDQALQERANAYLGERLLVQACADQEERYRQTDSAEVIQRAESAAVRGQQRVQQGGETEKQDEPRPLDARLALQEDCRRGRERHNPQRARQLDCGAHRQGDRAVFRGCAHHGAGVVDRQRRPQAELRLAHVQRQPDHREKEQRHGIQDEHRSERHGHLFFVGLGDGANGGNRAASANGGARADEKRRLLLHVDQVAKPQPQQHRAGDAQRRIEKPGLSRVQHFVQIFV